MTLSLDSLLTLDEFAALIRLDPKTVMSKTRGRKPAIPCARLGRKIVRFHLRTIYAQWAAECGVLESVIAAAFCQANFTLPKEVLSHHAE